MYVLPIEGSYYLVEENRIPNTGIEYNVFSLDEKGEKVRCPIKGYENKELPGKSIRLDAMNLFIDYDPKSKGGVNVSYNHDYRRAFDNIEQNKEYEEWVWEHTHNDKYGNLISMVAVDLENSGEVTKIAMYEEDHVMDKDYKCSTIAFDMEERVIDITSIRYDDYYEEGISVVQFGNTKGLMIGSCHYPQDIGSLFRKLVIKYDGEFVACTEMKKSGDSDYNVQTDVGADCDGNVYVKVWNNVESDIEFSLFYIFFLEGEFYEYDSVPIELDQLLCFDNYPEILDEIKPYSYFEEQYGNWGVIGEIKEKEIRFVDVMYSSNDMIYINYEVLTKEYDYFREMIMDYGYDICAVLKIQGNSLEHMGIEKKRRCLVSGENFKSYIREFDYE